MKQVPNITRQNFQERENSKRVDWLDRFADNLHNPKSAVEVARRRQIDSNSIVNQISSILNNNPVFGSVEDKVKDMQERTGLKNYLRSKASLDHLEPTLKDSVINFITNLVKNHHGNIPIAAVLHDTLETFSPRGLKEADLGEEDFIKEILDLIKEERDKGKNNTPDLNIGKDVGLHEEDANESVDFFKSMTGEGK